MRSIECFQQLLQELDDFQLLRVFEFQHTWNRECILQFYATLYITGNEEDCTTWVMEWMTEGRRIKCLAMDFVHHFHFPRFETNGKEIRVHRVDEVTPEEFHFTMDPEKVGDHIGSPRPENLTFHNQTIFHLLTYTICPLAGTTQDGTINGVLRNAIHAIVGGYIFDLEDMFLRILSDSAQSTHSFKVFAPWIQKVIDHSMQTIYLAKENHKSFIPPVRDTV